MRANRGKDTSPELLLRQSLRDTGGAGYRLHSRAIPGRPDIAYFGPRIAVFVHGCFWHRCPKCAIGRPKSHSEFWEGNFAANAERDRRVSRVLRSEGWLVVIVWEHEVRQNSGRAAMRVIRAVRSRRRPSGRPAAPPLPVPEDPGPLEVASYSRTNLRVFEHGLV
ncbi:MAG: very short patch repair endonuclease [Thermoplasmata archaeon]|nr:very short patch repair endonuclease [Thermoplasmata archaeon]